ncbi:MAG: hypothetical protein A2Y78_04635 [Acidobacteria bacterium RBG_13_68_16]|nr:MAG: hypothetical protein A2Y78_04635 [Acidobacteria bacterium RBG_13_68_16]
MAKRLWLEPALRVSAPCLGVACVVVLAAAIDSSAQAPSGANGTRDSFGYVVYDQSQPGCTYSFVDIRATGAPVSFTAPYRDPGLDPPADDDGGAAIALGAPLQFYGATVSQLMMSTNGYLATATSLDGDDGRDFSNDAPLPAVPGHTTSVSGQQIFGVAGRLMPYHDDLAAGGTGTAQQQYFPVCPRDSGTVTGEPCTVLQWSDWGFARGVPGTFSFQALLYHSSNAIAFQFAPLDPSGGASATVGIQDSEARVGLQYAANQSGAVPGGTSVCFYEPAFPLGGAVADVSLGVVNDEYLVQPGQQISYDVYVTNFGPSAVTGVVAAQTLPPQLSFAGDTCGGEFTDGSWAVGSLPPGGQTSCTVTLDVVGSSPTSVSVPLGASATEADPDAGNNSTAVVIAFQENGAAMIPTLGEAGLMIFATLLAALGALALRRSG